MEFTNSNLWSKPIVQTFAFSGPIRSNVCFCSVFIRNLFVPETSVMMTIDHNPFAHGQFVSGHNYSGSIFSSPHTV